MKDCNLIAYLLLASAVTTFLTSVVVEADTLDKGNQLPNLVANMNVQKMESNLAYQVLYIKMDIALSLYQRENVLPFKINSLVDIHPSKEAGKSTVMRML